MCLKHVDYPPIRTLTIDLDDIPLADYIPYWHLRRLPASCLDTREFRITYKLHIHSVRYISLWLQHRLVLPSCSMLSAYQNMLGAVEQRVQLLILLAIQIHIFVPCDKFIQ